MTEFKGSPKLEMTMEGRKAEWLKAAEHFGETAQRTAFYIEHDEAGAHIAFLLQMLPTQAPS